MDSSQDNKNIHGLPVGQYRCVWMVAGILSYQLCDREFDCDNCPLDAAMRKHFQPTENAESRRTKIRNLSSYLYSRNHCWLKPISGNLIRIGIEPRLAGLLIAPKEIVFPSIGDRLIKGKACLWLVLDGGTLALNAPVDGTVHTVNHRVAEQPHTIRFHPLTGGWLYELEIPLTDWQLLGLMKQEDAEKIFSSDAQRFHTRLAQSITHQHAGVGLTLQDGGQSLSDLFAMVGAREYMQLLREVFD